MLNNNTLRYKVTNYKGKSVGYEFLKMTKRLLGDMAEKYVGMTGG